MRDSTRAFVNVAVYAPLAFYGLRGKEPPAALLLLAGGYTILQFIEDLRVLKDAKAGNGAESVDGLGCPPALPRARGSRKRTRSAGRNLEAGGAGSANASASTPQNAEVIEFPKGE